MVSMAALSLILPVTFDVTNVTLSRFLEDFQSGKDKQNHWQTIKLPLKTLGYSFINWWGPIQLNKTLLSVPTSLFVRINFLLIWAVKICQKVADNFLNCFHLFKQKLSARDLLYLRLCHHVAVFLPLGPQVVFIIQWQKWRKCTYYKRGRETLWLWHFFFSPTFELNCSAADASVLRRMSQIL